MSSQLEPVCFKNGDHADILQTWMWEGEKDNGRGSGLSRGH
jgi:hypothetical protein